MDKVVSGAKWRGEGIYSIDNFGDRKNRETETLGSQYYYSLLRYTIACFVKDCSKCIVSRNGYRTSTTRQRT